MNTRAVSNVTPTALLNGRVGFAIVNGVGIMIMNVDKWSDADVIQLMQDSSRLGNRTTAPSNISHFYGDIFSASQRKLIVDWLAHEGIAPSPRSATLTDSRIMRAALVAYSWLTKTEAKAFLPEDRHGVAEWAANGLMAQPAAIKTAMETCYRLIGKTPP